MQGKNHVALALAIPLAGAMLLDTPLPATAWAWGGLVVGSLAPDIDGEGSIAYWGNFLPGRITPRPVVGLLNWLGTSISSLIRSVFGHRKLFHWPVWGVVLMLAASMLPSAYASILFWFGLGYILHILGDAMTKSGVPIFGPLWQADISFTPMVTGKFTESAFGVLLWLFVGWQAVNYVPVVSKIITGGCNAFCN